MSTQKQRYGVAIFDREIVLSDFTGASEKHFVVTPEQLMGFFRSEITFYAFPGLVWMKSNGTNDTYLILLPPGPRTILYRPAQEEMSEHRMIFPGIAVKATLSGREVTSIGMWGFAGAELKPESVLYELPLPNLGGSSLCLGATERSLGDDVRSAVEKVIFDTPFNHHSYLVGKTGLRFPDYVRQWGGFCPLHTLKHIGRGRDILGGR